MSGHNQNFIRLNYQSFYDAIMKDGDIKKIVKELTTKVPACENELKAFLSHIYSVEKQYSSNFITNEKYNTYLSRITAATIHFLDELSKGDTDSACQHLEIGEEKPWFFVD